MANIRLSKDIMAYSAAVLYGAAGLDGVVEGVLPGDPPFAVLPVLVVIAIFATLVMIGPRLPRWALATLGPLGVGLVAYTIATGTGSSDAVVLYMLPVLWATLFWGRRGAIAIIACVAVAHGVTLLISPGGWAYPGRWVDVMMSVGAIAWVVLMLERRNEQLLLRLADEARTDPLTGLLNRRGFDERASVALAHARREGGGISLVTFDLDHFKQINDEWGHETGDRVLTRIGEVLTAECRDVDVVGRRGGEEFSVLLPGSDDAGTDAFAQRVRAALAATGSSGLPPVQVSAGMMTAAGPTDIETMMAGADQALYRAKRGGRNNTVAFVGGDAAELDGVTSAA